MRTNTVQNGQRDSALDNATQPTKFRIDIPGDWDRKKDEAYVNARNRHTSKSDDPLMDLPLGSGQYAAVLEQIAIYIVGLTAYDYNYWDGIRALPPRNKIEVIRSRITSLQLAETDKEKFLQLLDDAACLEQMRVDAIMRFLREPDQVWLRELLDIAELAAENADAMEDFAAEHFGDFERLLRDPDPEYRYPRSHW